MQLELEAKAVAGSAGPEENFVVDALDAVNLKFVSSVEEIESSAAFSPEYAHQHFGETEKIFGYQNLDVTVLYTDATLYLTSLVKYDTKINGNSTIKCDDIDYKIKDCLPSTQLEAFLTFEKFKQKLGEQKKFRPFGTLIGKFQHTNPEGQTQQFELYKFEKKEENEPRLEEGLKFLERAQALAFWYIDAVSYTDEQDPRFFNYFLFESSSSTEDGLPRYKFAGYANLYRFYHHPSQSRVRIAQMLLAPPYRGAGLGHQFLQAFYTDLWTDESIYDITAETPADAFVYMRDYADCLNCSRLPQFSQVNLQKGFTPDKWEEARLKYKLNKAQTRRAYEILRLFHTNMNVPAERAQFKTEIIRRLKKLVMDPKKDGGRLSKVLAGDEQSMAIASMALDPEQQSQQLDTLYDGLLVDYRNVLNRLVKYEKNFIH